MYKKKTFGVKISDVIVLFLDFTLYVQQTKGELKSASNLRLYIAGGAFRVIGTLEGVPAVKKTKLLLVLKQNKIFHHFHTKIILLHFH